MAKNAITDWDTSAGSNTDIAGVNLAEGCAAAGINDAIRALMAQIATWLAAAAGPLLKTGGAVTGAITGMLTGSTVQDGAGTPRYVGYRNIPLTAKTTSYILALTDVGQGVTTTAGVTVPPNSSVAFAVGDTVAVYNDSGSSITITQGVGVTLRLVGTSTTGNRSLALRGICTLLKVATDEWIAAGGGVT